MPLLLLNIHSIIRAPLNLLLYISFSFLPRPSPCTLALLAQKKKSGVPFKIHVLTEARPSALKKHEQKTRHVKQSRDASYISGSFWNFGRFLSTPNTQDCVRCPPSPFGATEDMPRSLLGSRGSFFQPRIVPRRIKGLSFGRFFASFPPPLSKIIHRSHAI